MELILIALFNNQGNNNEGNFVPTITNYIAEQIELEDDEQEHGGISFIGETLNDFIQEERRAFEDYGTDDPDDEFIYDIPLEIMNFALHDCGIKKLTKEQVEKALEKAIQAMIGTNITHLHGNKYRKK